jgi:hypothetical protein
MPNTPQINLDIRNWHQTDANWTNTTSLPNGAPYAYRYTGGDDGAGGLVQVVNTGRDTAPLQLVADRRYQITNCTFKDDIKSQLSWTGNSPYAGTIVDANNQVENAKYTIVVTDTGNGNCTINCDPLVANRPPASE